MKKKISIALIFSISIYACSRQIVAVYYQTKAPHYLQLEPIKYLMKIPAGYKKTTLIGGHNELEKQFVYADSSKIYISDFPVSQLTYKNILSINDSTAKRRLSNIELQAKIAHELGKSYVPQDIMLEGKSADGMFWKDIRLGVLCIGYVNVPANKKIVFEKALASFAKK
jgi:hypothetical protein